MPRAAASTGAGRLRARICAYGPRRGGSGRDPAGGALGTVAAV